MRKELEKLRTEIESLERTQLSALTGELAELYVLILARLASPVAPAPPDESLNVKQAAKRLGISPSYLYKNHSRYKFARHEGGRVVFSASGLERYLQSKSRQ
jgi:Helix-turn-helix domain